MSHQSELIASDIESYLHQHEHKELLKLLTCGSVDDGKSTLIGRLLYDSKMIYEDQLAAIRRDSLTHGTTGDDFDPALLTDGLKAEREQGITIDVAYRYFSTAKRKFIIADTPGHEQYTRNMATGASTCDLAIILIDARHGVVVQTRRHSFIVSLLGIKHVVVAVNKMDLVDFDETVFDKIKTEYAAFAAKLEIPDVRFIPISALKGDNVVDRSKAMPWFQGAPLLSYLENVHIGSDRNFIDMRFPVQLVLRPDLSFRGYSGTVASGLIRKGDTVMVLPSRKTSTVRSIATYDGELDEAFPPQAVTVTLDDEIDISRGDMLVHPDNVPRVANDIEAMVVWMAEQPLVPGKQYWIKHTTRLVTASISTLRYRINVNSLHREQAPTLELNEVGRCVLTLSTAIAHDPYRKNKSTGSFIIIDRLTNNTVSAGMIIDREAADQQPTTDRWTADPQSEHLHYQVGEVSSEERLARFGQPPLTILITGLTGTGKRDIAYALERKLFDAGRTTTVLDGQNMRLGVSKDLGFTANDRSENLRRAAEVARLFNHAGILCIASFVAPHESVRQKARQVIGADRFLHVHLDASESHRRQRDQEGVYKLADSGKIAQFPGVSATYDEPTHPDLKLSTDDLSIAQCVDRILELLRQNSVDA